MGGKLANHNLNILKTHTNPTRAQATCNSQKSWKQEWPNDPFLVHVTRMGQFIKQLFQQMIGVLNTMLVFSFPTL